MPGLRVLIPDMVYFEVTQDLAKTGAEDIVQWARTHQCQVELVPTSVFSEFQIIRFADERTRSKGRGEQAALEVLTAEIDKDPDLEAPLLFEDHDGNRRRFVLGLPKRVTALSTGDLLYELEAAGLIQSSDRILDVAASRERDVALQRAPRSDENERSALRQHLQSHTTRPRTIDEG